MCDTYQKDLQQEFMIKSRILSILRLITPENMGKLMDSFNKGMKEFDKFMVSFNKGVQDFGNSMGTIDREMSSDVRSSQEHRKRESTKNQRNVQKLWGNSNNKVKIWSDKKSKESLF